MNMRLSQGLVCWLSLTALSQATVTTTVNQDTNYQGFAASLSNTDLIAGLLATERTDLGDIGWHPVNPAAGDSSLPQGLPTFTDGQNNGGLFGLLNDWADPFDPPRNAPIKVLDYDLGGSFDIGGVNILTGNEDADGRVFATFRVLVSSDNGSTFNPIDGFTPRDGVNSFGYFESNFPGQTNTTQIPNNNVLPAPERAAATWIQVSDDAGAALATAVTDIRFEFFAVHNTLHEYRDPFSADFPNPYVSVANADDGFTAANTSPLVWEIDVIEFTGSLACDFSGDGGCDLTDLNALLNEGPVASRVPTIPGSNDQFDLNGDGFIDNVDVNQWLTDAAATVGLNGPYLRGDANLDGNVDLSDFNLWNSNKFTTVLDWDRGDFNGDGQTDVSDFGIWNGNKFNSSGAVATVPEPTSGLLWMLVILGKFAAHQRTLVRKGIHDWVKPAAFSPNA